MDLNDLVEHYAVALFHVRGVYRYGIPAGSHGRQKTGPYPGFIFPLAGSAEYRFDDTPYLVNAETVIHGPADLMMDKRVIGDRSWEYVSVLYETYSDPAGVELEKAHFSLSIGQSSCLHDLLHQLHGVSRRSGGLSVFQVDTLFRRVLEETFLCAGNQTRYGARELFESVSAYIHAHYGDVLTVSALASQNNVNENRLFYVFQKYAGMGPGDYIRAYRLNRARDLLVTSSLPVGEIAMRTGYQDALHFSRIFKKYFGLSPSKFRKSL